MHVMNTNLTRVNTVRKLTFDIHTVASTSIYLRHQTMNLYESSEKKGEKEEKKKEKKKKEKR